MKNRTSILVGTRHFFYALLAVVILQSCGNRTPIIDGEKPFVVGTIVKYNETHSKYFAIDSKSGEWISNFEGKPMIILPSRMYQIGDTIKCEFNNR
jgi:hypothetical protein